MEGGGEKPMHAAVPVMWIYIKSILYKNLKHHQAFLGRIDFVNLKLVFPTLQPVRHGIL
jgi:hypothetical protein